MLPTWSCLPPRSLQLRTQSRERGPGLPQLTHPDFSKLPRPKFPDQLERLPGNFPFILCPGILWGRAHTGQGQRLAQTIPFLCIGEEKSSQRPSEQTSLRYHTVPRWVPCLLPPIVAGRAWCLEPALPETSGPCYFSSNPMSSIRPLTLDHQTESCQFLKSIWWTPTQLIHIVWDSYNKRTQELFQDPTASTPLTGIVLHQGLEGGEGDPRGDVIATVIQ